MSVQVSTLETSTFIGPELPRCVECGEWEELLAPGLPLGGWGLWDGAYCSACFLAVKCGEEPEDE